VYEFEKRVPGFGCTRKVFSQVTGSSMLDAEYKFKKPDDLIEKMKDFVGNTLKVKDGSFKTTPVMKNMPCLCIRG
jgi:hypothetical protein